MNVDGQFCLPLQTGTFDQAVKNIESHQDLYSRFELWLDCLTGWSDSSLLGVAKRFPGQLVVLFRRPNLDAVKLPLERRFELIDLLRTEEVLLDLDVTSQEEELQYFVAASNSEMPSRSCELIASYHNYQSTPSDLSLVIQKLEQWKPEIYKVATFCNSRVDAISLLSLLVVLQTSGKRAVVLGMGEYGKITRVFGPLWGNELHFAPLDEAEATAPGQLTRKQLQSLFELLA